MTEKRKPRADGLYRVKVYLGNVDGKAKYKYVYGSTPKEADEKADDIRARMKKGLTVDPGKETFGVWSQRWLRLKKSDVGVSQYQNYSNNLKRLSTLDFIPISKITVYDIQLIINELAERNPRTGKPSSKKTLYDVKNAAAQVMQFAIENRLLDFNPATAVRVPKSAPKTTRRALSKDERSWIENTPHRMQPAAMIMMYAGLRRGEVIPLLWSDIDLKQKTISVNKSVDLKAEKPKVKDGTKSAAGTRTVDIPKKLVDYLRGLNGKDGLVCPSLSGGLFTTDSWYAAWASYVVDLDIAHGDDKKAKKNKYAEQDITRKSKLDPRFQGISIEPITPHMLRHTFCTMLYHAGVDVLSAQHQMGHADPKTTLAIYTHLDTEHKRGEIKKLDKYLSA